MGNCWRRGALLSIIVGAAVLVGGCGDDGGGGGGGDITVSELAEASANAGPDQKAVYDATVTLDGSKSHGAGTTASPQGTTPASYAWAQTGGTITVALSDAGAAKPTFTAPAADDTLTFQLTVAGKTDTVTVTVQQLVVDVGPDFYVGGYGKGVDIAATVEPAGAWEYEWTMGTSPVPAEWTPANTDTATLSLVSPLLTDLKIIPNRFGVLPIGALSISRADISGSMSLTLTVADDLASPSVSASDTLNIQIVGVTSGGTVVPAGVPCFLNGGATVNGDAITSWTWAGTASLTQPDGSTAASTSDQIVMFVPAEEGDYYFVCTRTGPTNTDTKAVRIRAAGYVGVGSIAGRTPSQEKGECASCHRGQYDIIGDQTTEWELSGHNQIFANRFKAGSYSKDHYQDVSCFHCHTTGFDETDTSSNNGFDDRAAAAGVKFSSYSADAAGLDDFYAQHPAVADLAFVQCEMCHGPGSTHGGDTGGTASTTLTGMCAQCHEGHGHEVSQWERGTHAQLIDSEHATRDCAECHAGQGLPIKLRGEEVPELAAGEPVPQNCGTCHDTHSLELRATGSVALPNGVSFDFGQSAVCAHCHNGRRDTTDLAALAPEMPHHGSQQAMMLAGTGAFEYAGYTYVNGPHTAGTATNPSPARCNNCHMASKAAYQKMYHGALSDIPYDAMGGHSWRMRFGADGTALVDQTTSTAAMANVGTRELKIAGAASSFVGSVEIGDTVTFDGSDGGTFAVQAILSADTVLVEDPAPSTPTVFQGVTAPTTWSITRDERELVEGCQGCHTGGWPSTESLLIGVSGAGKNWDGSGTSSTPVQTRIQNLCDDLLAAIEAALTAKVGQAVTLVDYRKGRYTTDGGTTTYDYPGVGKTVSAPGGGTATWDSEWEAIYKATYNYFFVSQDRSDGIHNPGYAVGLLRSSYEDLTGAPHVGVDYTAP